MHTRIRAAFVVEKEGMRMVVVISQGTDFEHIDELVERIAEHNKEAKRSGGPVVACGMSKYDDDDSATEVFERADHAMYEDKARLKGERLGS